MTGDQIALKSKFSKPSGWLYLGGVPQELTNINLVDTGFIGCMFKLKVFLLEAPQCSLLIISCRYPDDIWTYLETPRMVTVLQSVRLWHVFQILALTEPHAPRTAKNGAAVVKMGNK
jgi:hypothetical protein